MSNMLSQKILKNNEPAVSRHFRPRNRRHGQRCGPTVREWERMACHAFLSEGVDDAMHNFDFLLVLYWIHLNGCSIRVLHE